MSESGKPEIAAGGRLHGVDLGLPGKVGPLDVLLRGAAIDQEISGHLGDVEFSLAGSVEDLATLGGPDLVISAEGPDLAAFAEPAGVELPPVSSNGLRSPKRPMPFPGRSRWARPAMISPRSRRGRENRR